MDVSDFFSTLLKGCGSSSKQSQHIHSLPPTIMKRISILVSEDFRTGSIIGPMEVLAEANRIYTELYPNHEHPFFQIELVSQGDRQIRTDGFTQIECYRNIQEVDDTDIVIIPAFSGSPEMMLQRNRSFIPWLQHLYRNERTELCSICVGAFLLAATGLLDGKPCTTHWTLIDSFQRMFPNVILRPQNILVDNGRIYSAGGATSYLNMMLFIIEKCCGHAVAVATSKIFLIDMDRKSQSYFAIFNTQKQHMDDSIIAAQQYIEKHYKDGLTVEAVAKSVALSKRNFIRRFKKATHNTPREYIQRVKIEAAKKALENTLDTVNEIVYQVGYNDIKAFRKVFKQLTGLTPLAYRRKYTQSMVLSRV